MTIQQSLVPAAAAMLMLSSIGAASAEESLATEPAEAQARAERNHLVSLGVGTIAGAPSLTYEHVWSRDRGLVLELHGLYLPTDAKGRTRVGGLIGLALQVSGVTSRGDDASTGLGVAIGHRWHWRKGQRSGFHGLHAGFDLGRSHHYSEGTTVEHGMLYVVGNTGRQWRMGNDFRFTARFGAGLALRLDGDEEERRSALSVRLLDELVGSLPVTLDVELSVGYAF